MANYQATLEEIFQALADPTRRQVLERLSLGPAAVSQLAEPFAMALPSFLQHLKVLEQGGLVRSEKLGRVRTYYLVPETVKRARTWFDNQLRVWDRRFDQLDSLLLALDAHETTNPDKHKEVT